MCATQRLPSPALLRTRSVTYLLQQGSTFPARGDSPHSYLSSLVFPPSFLIIPRSHGHCLIPHKAAAPEAPGFTLFWGRGKEHPMYFSTGRKREMMEQGPGFPTCRLRQGSSSLACRLRVGIKYSVSLLNASPPYTPCAPPIATPRKASACQGRKSELAEGPGRTKGQKRLVQRHKSGKAKSLK